MGTMFFFFGISTYLLFPKMWYMLFFCVVFVIFFWIYQLLKKHTGFGDYVLKGVPYFRIGSFNIVLTTLTYATFVTQYWLLLRPYGIDWFDQAKACFFILGIGSVPVSIAGIGFRETAAHFALQQFGVPSSVAVGTAFFVFFVNTFIPAGIGVILLSFFSDVKFRDIRNIIKKKNGKS
ncbi:MAG: hypothetical protein U5N26_03705 [Candidatus Marinimicrobia bacterium]|nr:hypothetical protein [Candidatus Neomarinimicrobiota bacterium]